jgi:hypothetical protein
LGRCATTSCPAGNCQFKALGLGIDSLKQSHREVKQVLGVLRCQDPRMSPVIAVFLDRVRKVLQGLRQPTILKQPSQT